MIIESGSDLLLVLNLTDEKGNRIRVASKSSFTIKVFTADRLKYLEYGKADIVTTNDYDKLYINSNELQVLESGVIAYTYMWGVGDKNFNDGEYNNQKTVYTDYYLQNRGGAGIPSNPVDYQTIQNIKNSIKEETDRATAVEGSLFNKMDEHQTEVNNRFNLEASETTSKVNTEATARKDADTALQGNIDTLSQTVTANKTASDKAISDVNAAVKTESDRAKAKESSLEGSINTEKNRATKKEGELSSAITAETTARTNADSALEGKITSLTNTVSSNKSTTDKAISDEVTRAKAAEAKALSDAKSDAASKYQVKGNYLTSHQDISSKLDKTTASQTYLSKSDAATKYQPKGNYLTSHQDISGKVDKVAGKGLSTNDYTTAEKKKLASLPDDFEPCTEEDILALFKNVGI